MALLSNDDLDTLRIDPSVFHVVGPDRADFQLHEAFDAGQHEPFFINRVRSVTRGNRYNFVPDALVRTKINRVARNRATFQAESEELASAFNDARGGSSAIARS